MQLKLSAVIALAAAAIVATEPALAQRGDGGRDRDHRGGNDRGWDGGSGNQDRGGRGWDRGGDRGRDHDRGGSNRHYGGGYSNSLNNNWGYGGWGYGYRRYYRDDDWWLGIGVGSALYGLLSTPDYGYSSYDYDPYGSAYGYGGYVYQQAPNPWGLAPYQCRWDREFGYWYNRPADIEVQRCADAYGTVYVVQGSHRLWRYR
ncbi:MAG: hypothetical protein R3C46_07565 [Hyphomonadaceae bacterium]